MHADKGEHCTCKGTVEDMLEICVITFVTTAKLDMLWSTTCIAWDTTACNCAVMLPTLRAVMVC